MPSQGVDWMDRVGGAAQSLRPADPAADPASVNSCLGGTDLLLGPRKFAERDLGLVPGGFIVDLRDALRLGLAGGCPEPSLLPLLSAVTAAALPTQSPSPAGSSLPCCCAFPL